MTSELLPLVNHPDVHYDFINQYKDYYEKIGKIIKDNCDFIATIPMTGKINSLNASVSCGIILSHIVSSRCL